MQQKDKALAFTSVLAQFTIAMVNFSLVYFLRDKHHFSSSEIGIASSIYTIFYFIFCIVFSKLPLRVNNKSKIISSLIGMGVSVLFVILSPNKWSVFVSLMLYGCTMALLWPNVESWITEGKEGWDLSAAVSRFNFSWSFGAGLSTAAGGILSSISIAYPLYASIALFVAASLFIVFIKDRTNSKKEEEITLVDNSTPLRYLCWAGVTIMYIGYSLIITIFPLYASASLGFSETLTGNLLLFRGVTACISFVILGRTSFWQFKAWVIFAVQIAFVILALIMTQIQSKIIFAPFFVVFGFVFALSYVLSMFHGASGAKNREKRMMVHEVLLTVGTVIGSLFGGIIYDNFSFNTVLYAISLATTVVIVVEILLYKIRLLRK